MNNFGVSVDEWFGDFTYQIILQNIFMTKKQEIIYVQFFN